MSNFLSYSWFYLAFCLICTLEACSFDKESEQDVFLDSIQASSIIEKQDQFIIAGTAINSTAEISQIKSPFIMVFDSALVKMSEHIFPTPTTSLDPKIISTSPTQYLLSYYRAKSLEDQTEVSELLCLDSDFKTTKTISYGNRTRIKDVLTLPNERIITLNYERSSQQISLQFIENKKLRNQVTYAVSSETTIPTSLLSTNENQIVITGIANGFHYPDGHEFKNPKAFGFIMQVDERGLEKNRHTYHGEGHVFIHDLLQVDTTLFAIGTHQSNETGMDQFILSLDSKVNLLSDTIYKEHGVQEWLLADTYIEQIYLAGISEDLNNHSMNLQLQCIKKNYQISWEKTIQDSGSYKPVDMVISKSHILLLVEKTSSRMSVSSSYIYLFTIEGTLLKKIEIN